MNAKESLIDEVIEKHGDEIIELYRKWAIRWSGDGLGFFDSEHFLKALHELEDRRILARDEELLEGKESDYNEGEEHA